MEKVERKAATLQYRWKAGARAPAGMKPEVVAAELAAVETAGATLRAEDVLRAAEDPQSQLHGWFEWDDTEAARQHRLHQARKLIASVVVVYHQDDRETEPVQAFVSLPDAPGYQPVAEVMAQPKERDELIEQARRDLVAWRKRYDGLQEFAELYRAIDRSAA